ncbi:MAG: ADP-ribosylation/crystallin J1 [Phyllobacteriaceae bacterium]|nr:ADP-ribosylation/crystallin J1 [Phyllobacteriaceae bacterium]
MSTTTLYRPVGAEELALIRQSRWTAFPPRLPEQPIFYPVTNEGYAIQIARDWNARHNSGGKGFVTRFEVDTLFLDRFERKVVGGREHEEYWIPAEDLAEFNSQIIGQIEVIHSFSKDEVTE